MVCKRRDITSTEKEKRIRAIAKSYVSLDWGKVEKSFVRQ